jgi:[acyl-carrier-protein] S-malonyltransferase
MGLFQRPVRAFLYPGQGSQSVGMAADLFREDERFHALIAHAETLVGHDLRKICLRGPERLLARTDLLQPLLVAVSLGYHRRLGDLGITPDVVAGHSLGEIAALAAASVVTDETAVTLAAWRGELMQAAAVDLDGSMLAVATDRREEFLSWFAATAPPEVVVANDNAPGQLVLSGRRGLLGEMAGRVAQAGLGRHRLLDVAGPWHGPWMAEARDRFGRRAARIPFAPPRIPILMNATGRPAVDPEEIRNQVIESVAAPVRWREIMEQLREMEVAAVFEVGPGRVLSGLARQNGVPATTRIFPVGSLRGIETMLAST